MRIDFTHIKLHIDYPHRYLEVYPGVLKSSWHDKEILPKLESDIGSLNWILENRLRQEYFGTPQAYELNWFV